MARKILGISDGRKIIGRPFGNIVNDKHLSEVLNAKTEQNQVFLEVGEK